MASKTLSPKNPALRIQKIRQTIEAGWYDAPKIDGVKVDSFTARHILNIYDNLNEENRVKFASMPIHQMASTAFRLHKKPGNYSSWQRSKPKTVHVRAYTRSKPR